MPVDHIVNRPCADVRAIVRNNDDYVGLAWYLCRVAERRSHAVRAG